MKIESLIYFWPTTINFPGLKKLKVEFLIYFRLLKSSGRKYVFHCFLADWLWLALVGWLTNCGWLWLAGQLALSGSVPFSFIFFPREKEIGGDRLQGAGDKGYCCLQGQNQPNIPGLKKLKVEF